MDLLKVLIQPDQAIQFLKALGIPEDKIKQVYGLNYDIDTNKITRETLGMIELFKKNKWGLNVGGNTKIIGVTTSYELNPLVSFHVGTTKKYDNFFDFKKGYGIYAGVEVFF